MARKKKELTPEELKMQKELLDKQRLNRELSDLQDRLYLIPEPTRIYNVGDEITLGNLEDVIIADVLEGGKIYLIDYTSIDNNYGNRVRYEHCKMYKNWMDLRTESIKKETVFIKNEDLRLNYSQRWMSDIFSKAYHFGINFEPEYQRDYVWELEDKVALIDSIFNCVDIGKFVFIRNEYGDKYLYEILDGKQRIRAILDFYEDRFKYQGCYFSDLSWQEQNHVMNYNINTAEISHITKEQTLRYFLMLNVGGKAMAKEQLDKVREMLEEEKAKNK